MQVLVLNINEGYNEELKKQCKTLREYMLYIDKVRHYRNQELMSLEEAVNKSIAECLKEDILTDFLNKNRREIVGLSIFEYDEEKELELLKKDQFEYGREQGTQFTLIKLVQKGILTITDAAVEANMSVNEFEQLMKTKTLH